MNQSNHIIAEPGSGSTVRRVVIATHNAKKAREMVAIIGGKFSQLEILTLEDYPGAPEPDETSETYEGNAIIKAEAALAYTGEWCIADDAGLEIDALPGDLGVHSKRFAGEETTFEQKMALILERLKVVKVENKAARFKCFVALARPSLPTETFQGTLEGTIADQPSGSYGFGYDPIFIPEGFTVTLANLTPEQKHAISHRGKVLAKLSLRLAEIL